MNNLFKVFDVLETKYKILIAVICLGIMFGVTYVAGEGIGKALYYIANQ